MKKILITGATGNVGREVIKALLQSDTPHQLIAGVRNPQESRDAFPEAVQLQHITFDFENAQTFEQALQGVDRLFLLRPPQLSSVDKYFKPLMEALKKHKVEEIVFLSVQGVEQSSVIPHHQIEKLIREYSFSYVFLRPGYFMQNLTTTLYQDIRQKRKIFIPAGKAKFNWVDVQDIGRSAAVVLNDFEKYRGLAFDITGDENLNFKQVTDLINLLTGAGLSYDSPNLLRFYAEKRKQGVAGAFIFVMIMLHYLPRYQSAPPISDAVFKLTGRKPNKLDDFISREKEKFLV
ncbi:MAG: NmrA family NAD(P)-binding protein [Cyclobacteriaceae bacterium]